MKTNKIPKVKICNRCKVEKGLIKNFKKEYRERLSGKYVWYHPWCFTCRIKVKEMWSIFGKPKGVKDVNTEEAKTMVRVQRNIRPRTNKTSNTKRTSRKVSIPKIKKHKNHMDNIRSSTSKSSSKRGTIIKTLKKLKDNVKNV